MAVVVGEGLFVQTGQERKRLQVGVHFSEDIEAKRREESCTLLGPQKSCSRVEDMHSKVATEAAKSHHGREHLSVLQLKQHVNSRISPQLPIVLFRIMQADKR